MHVLAKIATFVGIRFVGSCQAFKCGTKLVYRLRVEPILIRLSCQNRFLFSHNQGSRRRSEFLTGRTEDLLGLCGSYQEVMLSATLRYRVRDSEHTQRPLPIQSSMAFGGDHHLVNRVDDSTRVFQMDRVSGVLNLDRLAVG